MSATDPLSIAVAAIAFGIVALASSLVPASRASRMNPVDVLRAD